LDIDGHRAELEEVPNVDRRRLGIHRKQLTFDWVDEQNGKGERGRITPADREHLADWLTRFDPAVAGPVAFAMEGCTGWRYIAEEMAKAGVIAHLAEPADTSALRGPKRRAKTDKADAKLLRELLAPGRLPECYIAPAQVLEWRAPLGLYIKICGPDTPAGHNACSPGQRTVSRVHAASGSVHVLVTILLADHGCATTS
jgi:hypothetical protein